MLDFELDDADERECSDASVDEDELHEFLMGNVLAGAEPKSKKGSFVDKMLRRITRKKAKREGLVGVDSQPKKKKKKRKTAVHSSKLTPEQEALIGEANELYIQDKLDEAEIVLKELIRVAPGIHEPFHTLGLIKESRGRIDEAIGCFLVAALFVQSDVDLWRRIGEMSQENGYLDLAIYCFKKSLKTDHGEINEDVHFSLAICFLEQREYASAIKYLNVLFQLHPQDVVLATELVNCLTAIGDSQACLQVYQTYYDNTRDIKVVEPICQLFNKLQLHQSCIDFVKDLCTSLNCRGVDLEPNVMALYAISCIHLDVAVDDVLDKIWQMDLSDGSVYHKIAMAIVDKSPSKALGWFRRSFKVTDANVALKMASCLLEVQDNREDAIAVLNSVLDFEPNNAQVLLMLSDVLITSRKHSQAEELMARLSSLDLDRLQCIQMPIALEHRESLLNRLYDEVDVLITDALGNLQHRKSPCLLAHGHARVDFPLELKKRLNDWVDLFLHVIQDCELDTRRTILSLSNAKSTRGADASSRASSTSTCVAAGVVSSINLGNKLSVSDIIAASTQETASATSGDFISNSNYNASGNTTVPTASSIILPSSSRQTSSTSGTKALSFLRTKQELGLKSAEDVLGWKKYEELLSSASVVFALVDRLNALAALYEQIANNKKRYRSNVDYVQRQSLIAALEGLIFQIACFGHIYKIAMPYARGSNLGIYSRLLSSDRLARAAMLPLSASSERDVLLENRSWITRQLLQQPHNLQLQFLAGHFCTLSGNWNYAIDEYKRVHFDLPRDPLAALCLATAHLNSASSKHNKEADKSILLGALFLQKYARLRVSSANSQVAASVDSTTLAAINKVYTAETKYNMARCMQMINKPHLALELYHECLNLLNGLETAMVATGAPTPCPCISCAYARAKGLPVEHSALGFDSVDFVIRHCAARIRRSAAFNVYLVHMHNGNTPQAHHTASEYLVWK